MDTVNMGPVACGVACEQHANKARSGNGLDIIRYALMLALFTCLFAVFYVICFAPKAFAYTATYNISKDPVAFIDSTPSAAGTIYAGDSYYFNIWLSNYGDSASNQCQTIRLYVTFSGKGTACYHTESAGSGRQMIKGYEQIKIPSAGSFSYYWQMTNNDGSSWSTSTKTVTAYKHSTSYSYSNYSGICDGSDHTVSFSASGSGSYTYYYSTTTVLTSSNYSSYGSTSKPTRSAPGETTVYVYAKDNTGYYDDVSKTLSISIKPQVSVSAYVGAYDGTSHSISLYVLGASNIYFSDATVLTYSNYLSYGSTSLPHRAAVGTTDVYYIVVPSNNATSDTVVTGTTRITINRATVSLPSINNDLTYNGSFQEGIPSGSAYARDGMFNCIDAGTYSCVLALRDTSNYQWTDGTTAPKTVTWSIARASLSNAQIASIAPYVFDGLQKCPEPSVVVGSRTLSRGTDYTYSYSDNVNPGTATVTVSGTGNYTGSASRTFTIESAPKRDVVMPEFDNLFTYDGATKTSVAAGDGYVLSGTSSATDVGSYSWTASLVDAGGSQWSDGRTGNITIRWSIEPASIASASIGSISSYTYDGSEKKPSPAIALGGRTLSEGTDYTLSYSDNVNPGVATVTAEGRGNYTGTVSTRFTIQATPQKESVPIPSASNGLVNNFTYDSGAHTGVAAGAGYMRSGTYSATAVGVYMCTVYLADASRSQWADGTDGAKTVSWRISPASLSSATIAAIPDQPYTSNAITPSVTVTLDGRRLFEGSDYSLSFSGNIFPGQATVTATGKGNYTGTISRAFTIASVGGEDDGGGGGEEGGGSDTTKVDAVKKSLSKAKVKLSNKSYSYNGRAKKPAVSVRLSGKKLKKGTDYAIKYASGRKKVGTYKVTVKGKGAYKGSKTAKFKVVPAKLSIAHAYYVVEGVYKGARRGVEVQWDGKRTPGMLVRIRYSAPGASTSCEVTKAKYIKARKWPQWLGKKFYGKKVTVKIRAEKTVGGKTYCSPWSKAVKTDRALGIS